ncbi:prepilin-type N-terminal cleavage/methylation domain-containing protein [Acidovorax sp. HDW3]|uniref:prepilin-type N-terminal cleavage/methylation domain-containing protein n=1 Tax=Acidovorax sp. HDW3 TaxID=2714923 RepID=UPI00140A97E8|nr:prepilin-type N-terminal cleavage/methylation domain-containing protein [Acidovorax sp. HDW3]QIL43007.1 prepilin-type N-terminal cleavage/methylation domain-containing protein [Acidovorax sp. HDW3]
MRRADHQSGFTLIEMLIAMALLSLLALGMVFAMRTMGQTQDRIDQRFARADELQSVTAFVQTVLERLSSRRAGLQEPGKALLLFSGTQQSIEWLGIMPARHGMGGRYFFRLAVEPAASAQALVLRYQPWQGEVSLPDWSAARSRILVSDVVGMDIGYGGKEMAPQQWVPVWAQTESLPVRIRLGVTTRDGAWPLWIVGTRALSPGGGRSSMYSHGPGS